MMKTNPNEDENEAAKEPSSPDLQDELPGSWLFPMLADLGIMPFGMEEEEENEPLKEDEAHWPEPL